MKWHCTYENIVSVWLKPNKDRETWFPNIFLRKKNISYVKLSTLLLTNWLYVYKANAILTAKLNIRDIDEWFIKTLKIQIK